VNVVSPNAATSLLLEGAVVAIPTDTVYGLAVRLDDGQAIAKLFSLKKRPLHVALPVFVTSLDQINVLGVTWPARAKTLSDALWPGALTIVVAAPIELAKRVGATSATIGFRMVENEVVQSIVALTGPLCVTSANEHKQPPCTSAKDVIDIFADSSDLDAVVDGGVCNGTVSTVVDLSDEPWRVLREGALSAEVISSLLD
jgi:tRNA threonylcarbamoyl adenosine modification protein (Sua5/YciO/YrdC/YwlC family)